MAFSQHATIMGEGSTNLSTLALFFGGGGEDEIGFRTLIPLFKTKDKFTVSRGAETTGIITACQGIQLAIKVFTK